MEINLASASDHVFIGKLTEITLANLGDEAFGVSQLVEKTGLIHVVIRPMINCAICRVFKRYWLLNTRRIINESNEIV